MTDTNPVLYILMRNDLPSMNPGKAMAQASHASNAFVFSQLKTMLLRPWSTVKEFYNVFFGRKNPADDDATFIRWIRSTPQGFGTVLVLAVDERQMRSTVANADMLGFVTDVIHDPTYPILVPPELGETLAEMDNHSEFGVGEKHNYVTIPLDTCAYVFGSKNDSMLEVLVGLLPLHP